MKLHTVKASSNLMDRAGVLLIISNIISGSYDLSMFFDAGSFLAVITNATAKKLGLKGLDVCLSLTKVGNQKESVESNIYKIPLIIMANSGLWRLWTSIISLQKLRIWI